MDIQFIDLNKKKLKLHIGFSLLYFFFGPIYLFFKRKVLLGVFLIFTYYWLIPFPSLEKLINFSGINGSIASRILLFFRGSFIVLLGIFIFFLIHILMSLYIERFIAIKRIDKFGLLPATNDDAEKLSRVIKKYQDLPVHPSFIKEITFLSGKYDKNTTGDLKRGKLATGQTTTLVRKSRLEQQKQSQLNTLYEKYNSGFITFDELLEMQKKIIDL